MYRCGVKRGAIVAAAGRRIDPWDATVPRFPSSAVRETRRRIDDTLVRHKAIALVTSAACGADLLALSSAADLRLRRRVVLPFAPELFRKTSVTDRPGEWGPVFDETLLQLQAAGDVLILDGSPDDDGYAAVGEAILGEVERLAGESGDQSCRNGYLGRTPAPRRRSDGAVSRIRQPARIRNRRRSDARVPWITLCVIRLLG